MSMNVMVFNTKICSTEHFRTNDKQNTLYSLFIGEAPLDRTFGIQVYLKEMVPESKKYRAICILQWIKNKFVKGNVQEKI